MTNGELQRIQSLLERMIDWQCRTKFNGLRETELDMALDAVMREKRRKKGIMEAAKEGAK